MPRAGVVAVVPDAWSSVWTVRHQVLSRLTRFFEVVWVEPSLGWRDYWLPGRRASQHESTGMKAPEGLAVFRSGRWSPQVYKPLWLGMHIRQRRIRRAEAYLRRRGCDAIILYVWRPELGWATTAIESDLVCYHIDDEYTFSESDVPNQPSEVDLIRRADLVIVHSQRLLEKKGGINPNTVLVPNGVDFAAFSAAAAEPTDLRCVPRPRVGYVGVIKSQLDLSLILELAERRSDLAFVLVGPEGHIGNKRDALERLRRARNVHFLGKREVCELPAYTQHFDVCVMPYEVNDYTNYIYPLKMHEYLAAGRPVVATPITTVQQFASVVRLATGVEQWEAAIDECLSEPEQGTLRCLFRRESARNFDWTVLVEQISRRLNQGLSDVLR